MASLRRALIRTRESLQDVYTQIRADFAPMPSQTLFDFSRAEDVSRFQVTTDSVLGGATSCSFSLKAYRHFSVGSFSGTIDFPPASEEARSRGGFAAFRTRADERVRDLSAFEAFEMRIKTDGRPYIANFKSARHSPEQLWQVRLHAPPLKWVTLAIPFRELVLTKRGAIEAHQLELDREGFNSFGVLLADGQNGPFRFEIQSLSALRALDPSQWLRPPEIEGADERGRLRVLEPPVPSAEPVPTEAPAPGATIADQLRFYARQREGFTSGKGKRSS